MGFFIIVILLILFGVIIFFKKVTLEKKNSNSSIEEEEFLPYQAKKYLFSRSEKVFLHFLKNGIDGDKFMIFPKVRLADFIEVTEKGSEYRGWFNKIKSKHIDFIIWDIEKSKIALAIELDGNSHQSEKMIKRDEFVNSLYKKVEINLYRLKVGKEYDFHINEINMLLNSSFEVVE